MQIIRGTTPVITINVRSNVNLSNVSAVWVYIYQGGSVIIDKELTDVTIHAQTNQIVLRLSQEDTLALNAGMGALFQVRLLLSSGLALATPAIGVKVLEVYKDGIISGGT